MSENNNGQNQQVRKESVKNTTEATKFNPIEKSKELCTWVKENPSAVKTHGAAVGTGVVLGAAAALLIAHAMKQKNSETQEK